MFDFVETCIFVLRKKQNQVSTLHVYHHVSNFIFLWYYLKYVLDERATFISLYNCTVHVIMYIYYLLAAWSPNVRRKISFIKPFITKLQMASINIIYFINKSITQYYYTFYLKYTLIIPIFLFKYTGWRKKKWNFLKSL